MSTGQVRLHKEQEAPALAHSGKATGLAGTPLARGARLAELGLWAGAGLIALTVHVGAAVWLLQDPDTLIANDEPPAAIMIEVADVSEATLTEQNDISPDEQAAVDSTPAEASDAPQEIPAEDMPEETAEPPADTPTEEQEAETEPDEVPPPPQENVEVPLPLARPKPPERKVETPAQKPPRPERKREQKPRQQAQAASRAAIEAQAQTTASNRNAARQSTSGSTSTLSPATWQARLMAHLERRKTYPPGAKARGERGTVYVRFSIDEGGHVRAVSLARSSGFADLDQAVLVMVRQASPVPAPPPGVQRTITAPVRFSVR